MRLTIVVYAKKLYGIFYKQYDFLNKNNKKK